MKRPERMEPLFFPSALVVLDFLFSLLLGQTLKERCFVDRTFNVRKIID